MSLESLTTSERARALNMIVRRISRLTKLVRLEFYTHQVDRLTEPVVVKWFAAVSGELPGG